MLNNTLMNEMQLKVLGRKKLDSQEKTKNFGTFLPFESLRFQM